MNFVDRLLKCSDCGNDFIFTAGEQLFFVDRQFKNDPKRCKLCKARRVGRARTAGNSGSSGNSEGVEVLTALPLSRTETRTECSSCGIETTVPFKPTQGRPVFCRSCFQLKRLPSLTLEHAPAATPPPLSPAATMEAIAEAPAAALLGNEFRLGEPGDASLSALTIQPGA